MAEYSPFAPPGDEPGFWDGNSAPHHYRTADLLDGRFGVFLVHHKSREWWRLVAVFVNKERADLYAMMENNIAEWQDDLDERNATNAVEHPTWPKEVPSKLQLTEEWQSAPDTLPAEPPSGLSKLTDIIARAPAQTTAESPVGGGPTDAVEQEHEERPSAADSSQISGQSTVYSTSLNGPINYGPISFTASAPATVASPSKPKSRKSRRPHKSERYHDVAGRTKQIIDALINSLPKGVPVPQQELLKALKNFPVGSLTRNIDRLVKQGYVERTADKRIKVLKDANGELLVENVESADDPIVHAQRAWKDDIIGDVPAVLEADEPDDEDDEEEGEAAPAAAVETWDHLDPAAVHFREVREFLTDAGHSIINNGLSYTIDGMKATRDELVDQCNMMRKTSGLPPLRLIE